MSDLEGRSTSDLPERLRDDARWLERYPSYLSALTVVHLRNAADRIAELEAERDRWKKAASGWARKWNMLECDFCGTPMSLGDDITSCENLCEDECLGPCGNSTGELPW